MIARWLACGGLDGFEGGPPSPASGEETADPVGFGPRPPPDVVINEVMAKNDSTVQSSPAVYPDWFEVLVRSGDRVASSRVEVVLPGGRLAAWPGTALEPGVPTLVFCDRPPAAGQVPFSLDADGGTVSLRVDGVLVDRVTWPALLADQAWARYPDGGMFGLTARPTPGFTNGSAPGPHPDPVDDLFRVDVVHDLWLTLPPSSEASLRADPENAQVEGSLAFGAAWWPAIEVRLKGGWGSFRSYDAKAGFKLELDAYDPDGSLRGLEVLTLNNMVQDPTYIHEQMAYTVYRASGVPAPRVGYARLHVNGGFYGLFALVETVNDEFLERWFDDASGPLFEGAYGVDFYVGSEASFEYDEGPEPYDPSALTELAMLLDRSPTEPGIWDELNGLVDMERFLANMAVEAIIYHWDGYTTSNNYRVYHDPSTDLLTLIPWGTDQTFVDAWYGPYDARGRLFVWCMGSVDCLAGYDEALLSVAGVFEAIAPTLESTMDETLTLLAPDIAADPRRETSDVDLAWEVDVTRDTLHGAAQRIRDQVAR